MQCKDGKHGALWASGSVIALAAITVSIGTAGASCWSDSQVTAMAVNVAQGGFPKSASKMPTVVVCTGGDFGPGIGGDYTGGIHKIRIPQWQLNSSDLRSVLAHELAHAETWLTGGSDTNNGHSADFMRALLLAGWYGEAQRIGQQVHGAQDALNEARAAIYGEGASQGQRDGNYQPPIYTPPATYTPPTAMVQVCHDEQRTVYYFAIPGLLRRGIETRRFCRWVPSQ